MQPADTGAQGLPDHLGVLARSSAHARRQPQCSGIGGGSVRVLASATCARPAVSAADSNARKRLDRFFAGLVFHAALCAASPRACQVRSQYRATFLDREGAAVMGIGKDVLHPERQVGDDIWRAAMAACAAPAGVRLAARLVSPATTSPYRGASHCTKPARAWV